MPLALAYLMNNMKTATIHIERMGIQSSSQNGVHTYIYGKGNMFVFSLGTFFLTIFSNIKGVPFHLHRHIIRYCLELSQTKTI